MVERKGVHLLRPLIEKHQEWHWVLVGRPDDFSPNAWQFPNMTYFPFVPDEKLRNLYAAADVLVHPSIGEGITLIVSECMACGTPVIISMESLHEVDEADRTLFFPILPETRQIEITLAHVFESNTIVMRENIRAYALKTI